MRKYLRLILISGLLSLARLASAQTIFTNGANDSEWFNDANWNPGTAPNSSSVNVQIGSAQPAGDVIGIIGTNATVGTLTFLPALTAPVSILPGGTEQLNVNGNITNNDDNQHVFGLVTNMTANATIEGGTAGLQFNFLNVNTRTVSTSGPISIGSGGTLVFDINSLASFGSIGSISVSGATINVAGSYTGSPGNTFDLTTGNFTGASLGTLPTLSPGLSWDSSNFLSQGTLTVVPEVSSSVLVLAGVAAFGCLSWLRKKRTATKGPMFAK